MHITLLLRLMILITSGQWTFGQSNGQSNVESQCSLRRDPIEVLHPDADVFLIVLLSIHHHHPHGLLSCGELSPEGLLQFEAIKWSLNVLNQQGGAILNQRISQRFVPSVKLGAKIYDDCDHPEMAIDFLVKTFPQLASPDCHLIHDQSLSLSLNQSNGSLISNLKHLAVVDGVQVSLRPKVMESMINSFIPIVPLSIESAVHPSTRSKILARIIHDLEWTKLAIIHSNDEDSLFVVKSLGQLAQSGQVCLVAVEELPMISSSDDGPRKGVELRGYSRVFQSITSRNELNIPILVITNQESTSRLVRVMVDNPFLVSKHQWIFVQMPSPETIKEMQVILSGDNKIFTLTSYPLVIQAIEQFWNEIQFSDDKWYKEIISKLVSSKDTNNNINDCYSKGNCSDYDLVWRTTQSIPAIHSVFTFAYALRNAVVNLCKGHITDEDVILCHKMLSKLSRKDFVTDYLEPLQFSHSVDQRSPPELDGAAKTLESRPGEIENLKLALTRIQSNGQLIPEVLIVKNGEESKVINSNFNYVSSPCPPGGCQNCVKVRQSRVDDPLLIPELSTMELQTIHCENCSPKSSEFLYFDSKDDLIITAVVNVHESSKNPFKCSSVATLTGVQQVEAMLWSLDIINNHPQLLPGVNLGSLILDTCNSHQRASRDVSNLLSGNLLIRNEFDSTRKKLVLPSQVMGFLIEGDNSKIIDSIVDSASPLDILSIAPQSKDSKYNNIKLHSHLLRLSTPNDIFADSIIGLLIRFNWSLISVLYDSTSYRMTNLFNEFKTKSQFLGIEFAVEDQINGDTNLNNMILLINKLKAKSKIGAKVVVLLLKQEQIKKLLQVGKKLNYDLGPGSGIRSGEFLWITIESKEVFHEFPEESLGALTIQQQVQTMSAFKNYFFNLNSRNNTRNPWFSQIEHKMFVPNGNPISNGIVIDKETTLTINSMFAFANGLEIIRRKLCPEWRRGLCPAMKSHPKLSQLIYDVMRKSAFYGGDGRQVFFDYENGHAINSLIISNLRHFTKSQVGITSLAWLTVGKFSSDEGLAINLTKSRGYLTNGLDVPLTEIKSVCLHELSCNIHSHLHVLPPHRSPTIAPSSNEYSLNTIIPDGNSDVDSEKNYDQVNIKQTSSSRQEPNVLRRTPGIILAIFSSLGVVAVIICAFYFLMVLSVSVGTTVLGYQILFGLLLSFGINFAFLLPSTYTICSLRRFCFPIAWSLIISGMLVKVMNTWRLLSVKQTGLRGQHLKLTSPSGLLTVSLGLVSLQILFTIIWLIVFPPHPTIYQGTIKCSSSSLLLSSSSSSLAVDSEAAILIIYSILLLIITIFFSILTWKCPDGNREPRWILVCCLSLMIIWLIWFLQGSSSKDNSLSISLSNLLSSSSIMLFLYSRKLYIFTKLSRQARIERKLKSRLHQSGPDGHGAGHPFGHHHHQIYGALKSAQINSIIWDSEQRSTRGATRPPFDADQDDNLSSCGSVKSSGSAQVQGHDLYPMDVYDGGSQFAPMSSLFSQSNKSIYGIMDDTSFRWFLLRKSLQDKSPN